MITEMMMDNASKTRDYRWKKALRKPCACLCAGSYVRYLTDALTLQPEDEPNADFYRRIVESLAEASHDTSGALLKAWHARPIENGSCCTSPFQASACKNRLPDHKYRATTSNTRPALSRSYRPLAGSLHFDAARMAMKGGAGTLLLTRKQRLNH